MGNLGTFIKGAPLSKADITDEGTPFVLYGELYTTYGEVTHSIKRRTDKVVEPQFYSKVGDVIMPTSGETPEDIATASCIMLPDVILAGDLLIYRTQKVDGRLVSFVVKNKVNKQISSVAQGKSVVHVRAEELSKISISYPSDAEQQKILTMLELLEDKMAKQRELIEHLKKYKRGVIKEFLNPRTCPIKNAVWSKATMGELGTFVKGATLSKADISDEGTPFILYGELYTTYGEVINKVVRKTQRSVDNVYLSRSGDVLIPTSGETPEEISTASCVMVSGVILAGDLNIFRTSKVDGRIMSYVLNHIVNSNIARIAQGKSVVHIQASEISKISISYPDENTQQQLISVFDGISEKITLAEESLAKMIMLKKSIIQKMFI